MSESNAEMPTRPVLPQDHVLRSGAVIYPGAFDQHGCPLVVFPVESQDKLVSELTREEVADFIRYFLRLHSKSKEDCLVSVVADLREANLSIARRVAESLLLLELHRRTVHSVYVVQPRKRDVLKLLPKLLLPGKTKHSAHATYKCVLLKEVCELWNYIDRSQLTASLGGYLVYCHSSWVSFVKEIDGFVQEFVAVVRRLPVCISALQSVSTLPVPTDPDALSHFCSTNRTQLQHIRSDLGLDELLRRCELVLEKFRVPESDQCYQAMVGTHLYTHTALEMLHNYERITAAVEKVELLWQQAFAKARVQLQVLNLQREAQQIESQMARLWQKLQCYRTEEVTDSSRAETQRLEFEESVYTNAMALVRRAEDVIHTLAETVGERWVGEPWVEELERQKNEFRSAVELQYSSIRTQCLYHHCYSKVHSWYSLAVCESFLQDLLWETCCDGQGDVSAGREWKPALESFLRVHTCPQVEELVQLAHLANVISDPHLQTAGRQLAHRCMNLRKLLTSPGSATLRDLQLALQWQYEYLKGSRETVTSDLTPRRSVCAEVQPDSGFVSRSLRPPSQSDLSKQDAPFLRSMSTLDSMPPAGKPPSLSSFDSGFEGAGSGHADTGKEGPLGLPRMPCGRDITTRLKVPQLQISEENVSSVSDSEELDHGPAGNNSSKASIHIIPRITADSLNFEIKVQRSATLPKNPWLSLPVDDLENLYTVTISPSSPGLQRAPKSPSLSERCRDQPTQTDCVHSPKRKDGDGGFREEEFSPIRNVLSSTIAEGGADSTAEAPPTLLWDTYDLHDVRHDTCDRLSDVSLGNWELEEQQELRAVEEILGRTAGILQEEENILAQEEALDVLLKADHPDRQWPSWNHNVQLTQMSSSDLAEAGVIGLEEESSSPLHFGYHDDVSSSGPNSEALAPTDLHPNRSGVVQELKDLQVLEERILEEELKIQELRLSEKTPERRRKFLEELEREKKEVEELERSLSREEKQRDGKVKKRPRGQKVVKCSIMEMASALRSFEEDDEALLMNCRRQTQESKPEAIGSTHPRLTSDGATRNSKPSDSATDKFISCMDSGLSSKSRLSNSATDEIDGYIDSTSSHEPHLTTEESTSSKPSTSTTDEVKDLNQDVFDIHKDPDLAANEEPEPVTKESTNNDLYLSLDCGQDKLSLVSITSSSDGDALPHGCPSEKEYTVSEINILDPEKQKSDFICAVLNLSNMQVSTAGDPNEPPDPSEIRQETFIDLSESGISENVQSESRPDANKDHHFRKDAVESEIYSAEGLAPLETGQERAAFDPGGPKPLPRTPRLNKPSLRNQTSSISEEHVQGRDDDNSSVASFSSVAPSAGPKPKERKNPPLKILPAVAEHNRNNNNPRCVDLHGPGSETVRDSECEHEAMDQTEAECEGPISETESYGPCEKNDADVMNMRNDDGPSTRSVCRSPVLQQQLQISTREMSDYLTPVVLDTGSGLVKAGFADQDLPSVIFPNAVGLPKYEEVMSGSAERDMYVGHDAQHMRGVLTLHYPMKNGIISNWDQMETIWQHVFQQLRVDAEDHPVLLTEGVMNPLVNRQRMVQLMFESFNIPLTFIALQPVLALYAAGRTTGVVFDSGDGVSHSVPVFDGYSLPHAVQRFALAGADVTLQLKKLLLEQGVCMRTSAELEIVREIKERCCCVAPDYEAELNTGGGARTQSHYTLPDGQVVSLTTERFRAPEILFKPELIGCDHYGMHESIFKSVLQSDIDLRRSFLGNIVLSGGNTLLAGLPERLRSELGRLAPAGVSDSVRVLSPPGRDFSVWKGGAVLCGLQTFSSAWISHDEYEEFGPNIVHRKCF
ncbi:uncharacterized protein LOC118816023 [Colossoma macropomum]|uniref:uncharacterized protein LOC118816023 n=1 Tax=Colossoma macropomum TaxID=42526 RepID=UPI00186464EB|nr:uncharacterized protein LOC118816023 [Colossoma macropomum]